ncbi:uncharacterized protein LOC106458450 [Limulus polyphemus]|uniref:Uncharacterized protein LOC106458450 n=1 Tax=Limulus polyphemus TaxID=6850 RepID=A0ABM1S9R4_LIMPO|nr:uncharacterized protein LOC106458450 [Limulus polyphemus]
MSKVETLTDIGDVSVSNHHTPHSPDATKFLNSPITLDFDPLSFEFKESNSESIITSGLEGDEADQQIENDEIDFLSLKNHDKVSLNTQNSTSELQNRSHISGKKYVGDSLLRDREDSESSSDEQQTPSDGSGSESDIDSSDTHSDVNESKTVKEYVNSIANPEQRVTAPETAHIYHLPTPENDVKSFTKSENIIYTQEDVSPITTVLTTTSKTDTCTGDDGYLIQATGNYSYTYDDYESEEHKVIDLLENSISEEHDSLIDFVTESNLQEHRNRSVGEEWINENHELEHANKTNDKFLFKKIEDKEHDLYQNPSNKHDLFQTNVIVEHVVTPRELEFECDFMPIGTETKHDITPVNAKVEYDAISGEVDIEQDVTPRNKAIMKQEQLFPDAIEAEQVATPYMEHGKSKLEEHVVHEEHVVSYSSDSDVEQSGKKKKTTTKKKTKSSVRTVEEPKYSVSHSELQHKEKLIKHKENHEEMVTTSRRPEKITTRQYQEVNGVSESGKIHIDSDSENDHQEVNGSIVVSPISVAKLKTDYIKQATHDSQQEQAHKDSILENIDLKSMKQEYVTHAFHQSEHEQEPCKDSILKCIDLKTLTTSYIDQVQHSDPDLLSPTREVIWTGVDIHSLRRLYQAEKNKDEKVTSREVIQTGVNISELKSSFTEKKDTSIEKEPLEEIKPSVDRAKVSRTFNQNQKNENEIVCKICGQQVYLMDKIKAEKSAFHKSCFRCKECSKALSVDTYSSHEGEIYCKLHFRQLFQPKANFDQDAGLMLSDNQDEKGKLRKFEMIIRENVPQELPEDVVRCDTQVDVDLPSVPDLSDIRSRFESPQEEIHYASTTDKYSLQRSESVMQRLAKYQSAVSGQENGEMSSSGEDEDDDSSVVRGSKKKEKVKFVEMSNLKSRWENGKVGKHEGRGVDRREELSKLRQRICLGRSESMRAVYERACKEAENNIPSKTESINLGREVKAVSLKERFEKGDVENELELEKLEKARREKEDDLSVFSEAGTAAEARTLFKQIDATTSNVSLSSNKSSYYDRCGARETVSQSSASDGDATKFTDPVFRDDIEIDSLQVAQRFKFFENYKNEPTERKEFQITPPREIKKDQSTEREIIQDPNVVRSSDTADEGLITDTTKKMLHKFKKLENQPDVQVKRKPVKRITPPREYTAVNNENESSPEPERDPNIIRCSYKTEDEMTWEIDKAKSLRAKFEHWQPEVEQENTKNEEEECMPETDIAKNLRAKFEAIREESMKPKEKPKPRVKRFVDLGSATSEECDFCGKRLYLTEKMEASGLKFHRNCFRCTHCNCMLRLENYTTSGGKIYCTPHFKHLFISKQINETGQEIRSVVNQETVLAVNPEPVLAANQEPLFAAYHKSEIVPDPNTAVVNIEVASETVCNDFQETVDVEKVAT